MLIKNDESAAQIILDSNVLPDSYGLEKIEKALKDWDVLSVCRKDKPIGVCIIKDREIHFCILPEYQGRWLTKGLLKEISLLDFEYTTVPTDNFEKQDFVERMGFKPIQIIDSNIIYQLEDFYSWV